MSLITHIQTVIRPQLTLFIQVMTLLLLASCGGGGSSSEPVNSPASSSNSSSTTPSGNTGSTGSNNQTTNTTNTGTGSSGNDQDNDQSQTSNTDSSTLFETDSEMNIRLQAAQQTDQAASGQQSFMSPHVQPILAVGNRVYVTNTPSSTVDIVDAEEGAIAGSIPVGLEPIALALKPDKSELWVSNHVSDSVNVIDLDPSSPTFHQVVGLIDASSYQEADRYFDEPAGIAFASNAKAYVALSQENQIAVIDTARLEITKTIAVPAQDPRAIAVFEDKLFVLPFESNNQTQLSGCLPSKIDGERCTFDAIEHVFTNNNVLSLNYVADIIKNPELPDRDLLVYDTSSEQLIDTVEGLGTLLYGLTVTDSGQVVIAQTDARNDANGLAGSAGHGLAELENRPFLNQLSVVLCGTNDPCDTQASRIRLESPPPDQLGDGSALATPYSVVAIPDTSWIAGTAAGSDEVFIVDASQQTLLSRHSVGATPRGITSLTLAGKPSLWTYNAVDNSISRLSIEEDASLTPVQTIALLDPRPEALKQGWHLFESARTSTTGTFSCSSCHVDGHTDQLIWVLDTPKCDVAGCDQIQPRLTMPMRGLRDTAPYHWDGIVGDPHGGNNTANINTQLAPTCAKGVALDCARVLVDATLASTMCGTESCETGPSGLAGKLTTEERNQLAAFNLAIPFPPPPERPTSNRLSAPAFEGMREFHLEKDCGNCHLMPFLVSTNTPGTGMDAPTWRGAYDRWMILPQGRLNIIDLMNIVGMPDHFPEQRIWELAGASSDVWNMVTEGSTGFSSRIGQQAVLTRDTIDAGQRANIRALTLEATNGGISLQGTAFDLSTGQTGLLTFKEGEFFTSIDGGAGHSTDSLFNQVENADWHVTLTAHPPVNTQTETPQPGIWPDTAMHAQSNVIGYPQLTPEGTLTFRARHVYENSQLLIDGEPVDAELECVEGALPNCIDERVQATLSPLPEQGGFFQLQLQNSLGKFSNDLFFFSEVTAPEAQSGDLLKQTGRFDQCESRDASWEFVELNGSVSCDGGQLRASVDQASVAEPWRVQVFHRIPLLADREYTLCFDARADQARSISIYLDEGPNNYRLLTGRLAKDRVDIGSTWGTYEMTWQPTETDITSRVAFDLAEQSGSVFLDNISLNEGSHCP